MTPKTAEIYANNHRCDEMYFRPKAGQIVGKWGLEIDFEYGGWRIREADHNVCAPVVFCPWCGKRLAASASKPESTIEERVTELERRLP